MHARVVTFVLLAACSATTVAPRAEPTDPIVAEVYGDRIRTSDVDILLHTDLAKLDSDYSQRRYDMRRQGLDAILFRKLVQHEAARQGLDGEAYLQKEVEAKLAAPTEVELRELYASNVRKLAPLSYSDVRDQLATFILTQRRSEAIVDLFAKLKAQAQPVISLQPPLRTTPAIDRTAMITEHSL